MSIDEVLAVARAGAAAGCREALFTLGDKPELRYRVAREELEALGCETTLDYLARAAEAVLGETGLLPHLNPGVMTREDAARMRPVSASMGLMLETTSDRLSARGGPHFGSPDKVPARRLETLAAAGEERVPFTTGILIGIGETARGADRRAARDPRARRALRTRAGGDRPELPGEAGDAHGRCARAAARGAALDDRRRAHPARSPRASAGAAESVLRRLPAPARRRDRRLGRRFARDDRPRESRSALARARPAAQGHGEPRPRARTSPSRLSGVDLRRVDRSRRHAGGAASLRLAGAGARRRLVAGRRRVDPVRPA